MKRITFLCAVLALVLHVFPRGAYAAGSSAVPGGANQVNGVQATYPAPVFNGFVRIKPKYFGPARPQDNIIETPADGRQVLVFEAIISNGRTTPYLDDPSVLLSDSDGVTADTRSVEPNGIILQQAAGAKLHVVFWAPKDFVPDHLVFSCQTAKCKPIRILFKH